MATLPPPGSPEFMVIWTALQQFVDNQDDVDEPNPTGVAEAETAQRLVDEMTASFVTTMEGVAR